MTALRASRRERRSMGRREKRRILERDARHILDAHERGVSVRGIAASVGASERFVLRVFELARQLGLISDQDGDQGEGVGRK